MYRKSILTAGWFGWLALYSGDTVILIDATTIQSINSSKYQVLSQT